MYVYIYIYIYIYILETGQRGEPHVGGTRCAELGGGWSTQIFSEIVGPLSSLLNDSS